MTAASNGKPSTGARAIVLRPRTLQSIIAKRTDIKHARLSKKSRDAYGPRAVTSAWRRDATPRARPIQ
jgi:hypothetical protein